MVYSSKHGIFPIKDFVHIALVKGLFSLLALPVIQELRKSLIFHTICCNPSLYQLQIIPPSTAESDNLDKQPIASRLGLKPDTLKHFSWRSLKNLTQYFLSYPDASINGLSRGAKGVGKCLTYIRWADRARTFLWIFIRLYISLMAQTARQQYLFALFLLKTISLSIVAIPHCPSTHIN